VILNNGIELGVTYLLMLFACCSPVADALPVSITFFPGCGSTSHDACG
jgi:hypothetical protein